MALTAELLRKDRLDRFDDRVAPHSGKIRQDWVVRVGDRYLPVRLAGGRPGTPIEIEMAFDGARAADGQPPAGVPAKRSGAGVSASGP